MGGLSEFAGTQSGRFFKTLAPHIDQSKPPGSTPLPRSTFGGYIVNALLLRHIWASPNFVWIVISLVMYFAFPYDLGKNSAAASAPLSIVYFKERLLLWLVVTMGYNGFWHVVLYILNWSERPYIPNRIYNLSKVAHNVAYSCSGVVMWVAFENVFAYLWATGRLPYLSDQAAATSIPGALRFVAGIVLLPLWRDVHFYFAHRLLHFRPIFQHVHALHHRNTDVEPFSGICMHPMEHLYYFSCVLPSIFCYASPIHLLWNGIHLLITPAASHSGYEDHWQYDTYHYYHHRYFENNYGGSSAAYLDMWFGSFYGDGWKEKGGITNLRDDSKANADIIHNPPTLPYIAYMVLSLSCQAVWALRVLNPTPPSQRTAIFLSILAGFGPLILAIVFYVIKEGPVALTAPFQKRPMWETALHIIVGNLLCSVPIAAMCYLSF
jgi:sterol desaturase/sphingolipid hydroxylase (fatty acid hydroxylase superfamily)